MNKRQMIFANIALLVGGIGFIYLYPALALKRLQFRLSHFTFIDMMYNNYIDFGVNLNVLNPTGTNLTINSFYFDVYLNGDLVGYFTYRGNVKVPARGTNMLPVVIRIEKNQLAQTIWDNIISTNFTNSILTVQGSITANLKTYPFTTDLSI